MERSSTMYPRDLEGWTLRLAWEVVGVVEGDNTLRSCWAGY